MLHCFEFEHNLNRKLSCFKIYSHVRLLHQHLNQPLGEIFPFDDDLIDINLIANSINRSMCLSQQNSGNMSSNESNSGSSFESSLNAMSLAADSNDLAWTLTKTMRNGHKKESYKLSSMGI